jgi:hypothetical protein
VSSAIATRQAFSKRLTTKRLLSSAESRHVTRFFCVVDPCPIRCLQSGLRLDIWWSKSCLHMLQRHARWLLISRRSAATPVHLQARTDRHAWIWAWNDIDGLCTAARLSLALPLSFCDLKYNSSNSKCKACHACSCSCTATVTVCIRGPAARLYTSALRLRLELPEAATAPQHAASRPGGVLI